MSPELPLVLRLAKEYAIEMDHHRDQIHRLSELRHEALAEARGMGLSVAAIAGALGISRQQVNRLLRRRADAA